MSANRIVIRNVADSDARTIVVGTAQRWFEFRTRAHRLERRRSNPPEAEVNFCIAFRLPSNVGSQHKIDPTWSSFVPPGPKLLNPMVLRELPDLIAASKPGEDLG